MGWATFWAIFSQTRLVALAENRVRERIKIQRFFFDFEIDWRKKLLRIEVAEQTFSFFCTFQREIG
jgi:hypothetical protein